MIRLAYVIANVRKIHDINDQERRILINGVELAPTSTDPEYQFSDLDNEGVRAYLTGVLTRNRIRSNVLSINNLVWSEIDPDYANELFKMTSASSFTVNVYDRTQGKRVNKTMYRSGDATFTEIRTVNGWVAAVSFSLIEL